MNLNDIKDRCRIEDGHWLWSGAISNTLPRVWAPDYTLRAGGMTNQTGRRGVWHLKTRQPIPIGWRVFGTCKEPKCMNPAHMVCRATSEQGAMVAASGKLKGSVHRITANRATGRKRTALSPELRGWLNETPQTGVDAAHGLGVSVQTISKFKTGKAMSLEPVGGLFTGLLAAANDFNRRASA
jgi:hypothetical protein